MIIKIKISNKENLFITAAYATYENQKDFNYEFNNLFELLQLNKPENYYIIAGDLKAKHTSWKNEINNTRGNFIRNWLDNKSIHYKTNLYSSELPSYPKGGSYLDICLADARLKFQNLRPNNTLNTLAYDSDHNALVFHINKNTSDFLTLETQTETPRYNYKKTDWKKFQNILEQNCDLKIYNNVNLTNRQIDSFIDEIEKHTQIALQKSVPIIKQKNSCEPYINNKIKDLHRDKSYILSKINNIKFNYSYDKREELEFLKYLLHRIKAQLKQEFANSINHYWTNKIKNISKNDSANMFPQINQIFRAKEQNPIPPLKLPPENASLIQEAGITIYNTIKDTEGNFIISKTIEKLDIIGTHFSKIHTQNEHMGREQLNRIIIVETNKLKNELEQDNTLNKTVCTFPNENTADNPKQPDPEINYFTNYNQLNTILSKLNNKKSSGFDGIPNILLKRLPNKIKWYYTVLFNNALNNTYFPRKWKKAKLIAITKKDKDGSSPANLRPISLLPNISKVFEIIINNPLTSFCTKNNIIPENQFGFRHKHSTIHAINKLTLDICWALNAKERVAACLIDLEKAFDTVWIPGLIYKLIKKKFPKHLIKIVWDMITNRTFAMTEGSHSSSKEFSIKNGLQQAFADDLIIYVTGRKTKTIKTELQELFEKINDYYHAWKLKINISKCETILFRPKSSEIGPIEREHCKKFQIREKTDKGALIPHKNCVKYLGVNIDYKLNYKQHTEIQLTKANKAFWKMKKLFHSKHLDSKVKILCYQALIRPIITYGCPIWYNISASQMEKIRIFERKCIRACLSTYRSEHSGFKKYVKNKIIYDLANVHRIDCHILKLIRNHFAQAAKIKENSLIFSCLFPNDTYYKNTLTTGYIPPEAFPYLFIYLLKLQSILALRIFSNFSGVAQ
ncbi:uncharacterized protein LOC143304841 [Bombus vancouverensis nearcticus]|uniref:uncharacterized protein LOC143304162 n=1 Tax=Bombus vancouverensis nearcticus TaxID=2705178 RepID=UPI00402B2CC8